MKVGRLGIVGVTVALLVVVSLILSAFFCVFPWSMTVSWAAAKGITRRSLNGTWRWEESTNGSLSITHSTPEACGCERFLVLKSDSSYEYVEQDSAHEYVLTRGKIQVHWATAQEFVRNPGAWSWLSLEHGLQVDGHQEDKSFRFYGPDTLRLLNSESGDVAYDAGWDRFVRDGGSTATAQRRKRLPQAAEGAK